VHNLLTAGISNLLSMLLAFLIFDSDAAVSNMTLLLLSLN